MGFELNRGTALLTSRKNPWSQFVWRAFTIYKFLVTRERQGTEARPGGFRVGTNTAPGLCNSSINKHHETFTTL